MYKRQIKYSKSIGKLVSLKKKLIKSPLDGYVGIGHTRWATHGEPIEFNAHPHVTKNVAVVHNGIIENFAEFKDVLLKKGINFESQTDTEVIAKLVEEKISKENLGPLEAVRLTVEKLRGSFALCFIFRGYENFMVATRRGSPLALGFGDRENFVSSDALSLSIFSKKVCYLEEGDFAKLTSDEVKMYDSYGNSIFRDLHVLYTDPVNLSKGKYLSLIHI